MLSFLLSHHPSEKRGGEEGAERKGGKEGGREGERKGEREGRREGGQEGGILLSANSLLKILISLKASKELFSP